MRELDHGLAGRDLLALLVAHHDVDQDPARVRGHLFRFHDAGRLDGVAGSDRLDPAGYEPVRPGDTIQPTGIVKSKQVTANSRWVLIDVMVRNQKDEKVATGEAMVEFPHR